MLEFVLLWLNTLPTDARSSAFQFIRFLQLQKYLYNLVDSLITFYVCESLDSLISTIHLPIVELILVDLLNLYCVDCPTTNVFYFYSSILL